MTAATADRSFNGNHTFACALRTRGGVCDCWSGPEPAGTAWQDHRYPASVSDLAAPSLLDRLPHADPE